MLTLKVLCADELMAGSDPLRNRVGSEASTDATNLSYCAKLVFEYLPSLEAKSVIEGAKTDECGVRLDGDDDADEKARSWQVPYVDDDSTLHVFRFCKVEAAIPSEFALVTRSLSIWSSETPGGSCSTSEAYKSGLGAAVGAGGLGERWFVAAKDPIVAVSWFAVNAFWASKRRSTGDCQLPGV